MDAQQYLLLLIPLMIPVFLYVYLSGFYWPIFALACALSACVLSISDERQVILFLVAFCLALIGDPLNVLMRTWGYSGNGWYVHETELILVALGWGLISWVAFTASSLLSSSTAITLAVTGAAILGVAGFFLSNAFPVGSGLWIGFMAVLVYKLYSLASRREKTLIPLAFALGLLVEFCGVFLGAWWYGNPANHSILDVVSISLSYSLLVWMFSRISVSISKAGVR